MKTNETEINFRADCVMYITCVDCSTCQCVKKENIATKRWSIPKMAWAATF